MSMEQWLPAPGERLRLMSVHAHPDDESSKGAATVARYSDEGVYNVLVCCTGGEEGDILNEEMNRPEVIENLADVRRAELEKAVDVIGYETLLWLGYRDSGMKDSESNSHPDCFAAAPLDEAVTRLAVMIRSERPHVVMSYAPSRGGYNHPDHERVHEITDPAIALAADPDAAIDGEPWQVTKLYFMTWAKARILALHEQFLAHELESQYSQEWLDREGNDHLITTKVSCGPWYQRRADALLAHATQVDPNSKFWFGLPDNAAATAYPWEDYERIWSHVDVPDDEDDLFAGLRVAAEAH